MSKSTSLSIGLFLLVYFCKVKNRSTKPLTAFYNARKNGKLPLHSYTTATRNRPLCYICAEVIIMCLCCYPIIKKSGPNIKEEPPATPLAREERFRSISRPTQRRGHRVALALALIIPYYCAFGNSALSFAYTRSIMIATSSRFAASRGLSPSVIPFATAL